MKNQFTKNLKLTLILVAVIVWFVLFFKTKIGAIFLLLAGVLIYPKSKKYLAEHIPILKNQLFGIGLPILFVVVGLGFFGAHSSQKKAKELAMNTVIKYIQENKDYEPFTSIRTLEETGKLFGNSGSAISGYMNQSNFRERLDEKTGIKTITFDPKLNLTKQEDRHLLSTDNYGKLQDYFIEFEVDKKGNILSKQAFITYDKEGTLAYNFNEIPDINQFLNQEAINTQRDIIRAKEQNKRDLEAYKERNEKFEEKCINPWNGSHIKLVNLIKENMNNPNSFEHVETTYRLFKGYAVVQMSYRGTNAFGGIVTNYISARVNLEDCTIMEILKQS